MAANVFVWNFGQTGSVVLSLFSVLFFEKRKRRYPAPTTHVRGCLVRMELCYYGPDFVSLFSRLSMQNCRYSRLINWVAHDWPSWSSWFEVLFCNEWLDISIVRPNDRIVWPSVDCQLTSPRRIVHFFCRSVFLSVLFYLWTTRLVVGFWIVWFLVNFEFVVIIDLRDLNDAVLKSSLGDVDEHGKGPEAVNKSYVVGVYIGNKCKTKVQVRSRTRERIVTSRFKFWDDGVKLPRKLVFWRRGGRSCRGFLVIYIYYKTSLLWSCSATMQPRERKLQLVESTFCPKLATSFCTFSKQERCFRAIWRLETGGQLTVNWLASDWRSVLQCCSGFQVIRARLVSAVYNQCWKSWQSFRSNVGEIRRFNHENVQNCKGTNSGGAKYANAVFIVLAFVFLKEHVSPCMSHFFALFSLFLHCFILRLHFRSFRFTFLAPC